MTKLSLLHGEIKGQTLYRNHSTKFDQSTFRYFRCAKDHFTKFDQFTFRRAKVKSEDSVMSPHST